MSNSIGLINDSHFGIRGDSNVFLNNQIDFFQEFFIPELQKRGITRVVWAGDIFDKRKTVNIRTLSRVRKEIFKPLKDAGIKILALAGNHDIFHKNRNDYNSIRELLGDYENIEIIDTLPECRGEFGGKHKILYVPWICQANYDDTIGMLNGTDAQVVIGHFELKGFDMHPGIPCHHGMSSDIFKRFSKVLSGHFHTRSTLGNITYLGTQYEMTWADCEDPKGFNILNEDLTLDFIRYDNPTFIRLLWDNGVDGEWPLEGLKDKYIKVIVKNIGTNPKSLDAMIAMLQNQEPADLKIVEDEHRSAVDEALDVDVEDTAMLMNKYVDTLEFAGNTNSNAVKSILQELHTEALGME